MMPGMDGMEVCRRVRSWTNIPIIILSARGDEHDKVKCLEMGADDYLTKPCGIGELVARVQNALRHRPNSRTAAAPAVFNSGDMEIHFASRQVLVGGKEIVLTQTEFNLLSLMVLNANKALTHIILLGSVWGDEYSSEKEYLRVFVSRLRRKLGLTTRSYPSIQTIPGVGYIRTGDKPADQREMAGALRKGTDMNILHIEDDGKYRRRLNYCSRSLCPSKSIHYRHGVREVLTSFITAGRTSFFLTWFADITGYEVIKCVREFTKTPIIVITARREAEGEGQMPATLVLKILLRSRSSITTCRKHS
jgi:two-component system KDP operon response regulator KdpE